MKYRLFLAVFILASFLNFDIIFANSDEKNNTPDESELRILIDRYYRTDQAEQVERIRRQILALNPDPERLYRLMKAGPNYRKRDSKERGWGEALFDVPGGKRQFYICYVPKDYLPQKRYPLLVYLRGAIGHRYTLKMFRRWAESWKPHIADLDCLMVLPNDNSQQMWWSRNGLNTVDGILRAMKMRFNIDEDRVYLMGFSDGATACQWMAAVDPSPWAGFLAMSGDFSVSKSSPYQVYPENLAGSFLRIVNGEDDPVYPGKWIEQVIIRKLKGWGIPVEWQLYYGVGHRLDYLGREIPRIRQMLSTERLPFRQQIRWLSSDPRTGRRDWLMIDKIGDQRDSKHILNFQSRPIFFDLGIKEDGSFRGPGIKIWAVLHRKIAQSIGLKKGDIIVQLDDRSIVDKKDLTEFGKSKKYNELLRITVMRSGIRKVFKGFIRYKSLAVFPRTDPTAYVETEWAGNTVTILTRNTRQFSLLIRRDIFDIRQPLTVIVDGKKRFHQIIRPDPETMLRLYHRYLDRTRIYIKEISFRQ